AFSITTLFTASKRRELSEDEHKLALLSTDLFTVTMKGNSENCRIFGEVMGSKPLLDLIVSVQYCEWRSSALQLLKQLLLMSSSDSYLSSLLNCINRCILPKDISLTYELLKSILSVLRESHKVRILFRRSGGYVCLISVVLSLETTLSPSSEPISSSSSISPSLPPLQLVILDLINLIFKVLTISMRFEPSNAKFFSVEVNWESVTTVLRLTGAFTNSTQLSDINEDEKELKPLLYMCHQVFRMDDTIHTGILPDGMPIIIFYECYLIRLLFNMALDNYEKPASDVSFSTNDSLEDSFITWTSSLLVHPGAILSLLHLIPSIESIDKKWTLATRLYVTLLVKSLLRPERNQQLMCQLEMPRHLLSVCSSVFLLPSHILLPHLHYLLERLSYQSMAPSQLRQFLRLDLPLCCRNLDEIKGESPIRTTEGGPIPLSRVKALVSMITPRDRRLSNAPSFVEFDMTHEGFGCLFLPSLSPLSPSTPNRMERPFPPINGLSYSVWMFIDSFSDKKLDAHPLRLLTLSRVRHNTQRNERQSTAAFTVQLSSIDRSLLISTEEYDVPGCDLEKEANFQSDKVVRIPLVDSIREKEWIHLCIVLSRSLIKKSQLSVYLNGQVIATHKMQYIIENMGGGSSQLVPTLAVNAIIGTAPVMRRPSRLRWRLASMMLIEDTLTNESVHRIFSLQPHYIGSLQTVGIDRGPLVQEEKIIFSLNGAAVDELTLAKIRGLYCQLDADMSAGLLGLNSSDNSSPLRILLNTSSHAFGPGRSFGAIIVGYLGMRSFAPRSVPRLIDSIGGYPCLFALVAMATDSEGLYASLKTIVSAVRSNTNLYDSINSNRAYQMLSILIEDKGHLLNSHIVHLIFALVGTLDTTRETASIPNVQAFEDVVADLHVWSGTTDEMHKMLFEHVYELVIDHRMDNLRVVRSSNMLSRLLLTVMNRPSLLISTHDILFNLISAISRPPADDRSILKLGQFIASTLPLTQCEIEEECRQPLSMEELHNGLMATALPLSSSLHRLFAVYIRNKLVSMIHFFLVNSSPSISSSFSDQLAKILGFDWLLALMSPKVHETTVFLSLKILLIVLSKSSLLHKFREGQSNGGWLADAESIVRNSAATVLGFSVSVDIGTVGSQVVINPETANCAGFCALEHILATHCERPFVYVGMFALLVGQPVKDMLIMDQFNVDIIWNEVFGLKGNSSVLDAINSAEFCYDALFVLFSLIRSCIYSGDITRDTSCRTQYSCTTIQMITFLYQNCRSFFSVCHSHEFIVIVFSSLLSEEWNKETDTSPDMETLTHHLNSQSGVAVLDFMKRIIMDELQANGDKNERLLDTLMETVSDCCSPYRPLHQMALSSLISLLLSEILSTDLLESSSLPPHSNPLSSHAIHANIYNLCSKIVDGIWQSLLISSDPLKMLTFFNDIHLIAAQRDSKGEMDSLINAMMRCILYILSRPIDSITQQMIVLDTLTSLVTKKYIYLQSNDAWFFCSLTHLIFMLSVTPDILSSSDRLGKGSAQVAVAASRVWSDVVCSKKIILEETLRRSSVSELNGARALLASAAGQYWRAFVEGQLARMNTSATLNRPLLHQQISQRINQVTSGFSKLPLLSRRSLSASPSNSLKKTELMRLGCVTSEVVFLWLRLHSSLLRQLVLSQSVRYHEWHSHVKKWCLHEWSSLEAQLTRERAIWGPDEACSLDKFRLDTTEGPGRLRRKLIPNRQFYHDYPYRPYLEDPSAKALRAKVAISKDSKAYYDAHRRRRPKTIDEDIIENNSRVESCDSDKEEMTMDLEMFKSSMMKRVAVNDREEMQGKEDGGNKDEREEEDAEEDMEIREDKKEDENNKRDGEEKEMNEMMERKKEKRGPDNQTLLRLLEQGEQIHSMFRCARVQGLESAEGLLLFGKDHYYVVDGFTLLKTKEIRDLDFLPPDLHDPIVPYTATGSTSPPRVSRICSKFSYDNIREVHKRRYLLQPIALEVFSADGRNYLLAFPKRMRDRVYDKLLSMARGLREGGKESVGGQRWNMSMEQTGRTLLINSLTGQQSVTQRWVNGQISNLQYLMHLNTLAGRGYNDLSQYPVFPWVLSDYSSSNLDLSNPSSFRDLSRPMGAQNKDRLDQFLKRYNEWDDPSGETPPYMYGTHYSSSMIVVSYLVRLEPFTQQFLSLQGGHFDLADRMFHSIGDAWNSASKNNMADVKELIPEFFFLPEMFINNNKFDLGRKQSGIEVNDVILPPWAKNDPREFVRVHRMALESDYVSQNLNDWIDLIFGYKQNGEEAIVGHNLFHHL
ncbi:hypothetical protein PFISCL1PPCAC_15488, partial [Pristionchus fissidentatus]